MEPIIECIPNVSEGKNQILIDQIANQIKTVDGVQLLNVDGGIGANRTVFTFAGPMRQVFKAAEKLICVASEGIDMRRQTGEHPRIGAVDVCPFVPISGISESELAKETELFAEKISSTLSIPVYLYEQNAKSHHRTRLEQIRKGEYEGLEAKRKNKNWQPDFGKEHHNPKFGAMITGTRNFLIAYNINLNSCNTQIADKIAKTIRTSGYIKTSNNQRTQVPGMFPNLKAIGWYIDDFKCSQISTNITNYETTPVHEVFEAVKRLADEQGEKVNGSELIGLIPYKALADCGKAYTKSEEASTILKAAILALGLDSVKKFVVNDRVLEIKMGIMEPV